MLSFRVPYALIPSALSFDSECPILSFRMLTLVGPCLNPDKPVAWEHLIKRN